MRVRWWLTDFDGVPLSGFGDLDEAVKGAIIGEEEA